MKTEERLEEREVTVEYLEKAFDHYNHLCFGGLLPRPSLRLSRAKSRLGWMRYKVDANGESLIPYDFTIGITTAYRLNTEQIDDVLIHEMIHYHIVYHQLRDNAPHGRRFRQIMETINHDYQRHICISVRHTNLSTNDGLASQTPHNCSDHRRSKRLPPYFVLVIQTTDDHYYLSSVAPNAVGKLHAIACKQKHFRQVRWFVSNDPTFSRFPRVRTLRGVSISQEEYNRITSEGTPL